MLSDMARGFLEKNEMGVFTTFRRDGGAQMSVVTCGLYGNGMAFTADRHRAKMLNVKRNPKCSLLISQRDWWGYVVLEGHAEIIGEDNTDPRSSAWRCATSTAPRPTRTTPTGRSTTR